MDDDALELISHLRKLVEERFRSLNAARSEKDQKKAARARLQEIEKVVRQLESLIFPTPEEVKSEKMALEEYLRIPIKNPSREKSELVSLAKNLSSLAQYINHRLRDMRTSKMTRAGRAPRKKLRVEFPDGTVVFEENATRTFVEAIRFIGLKRVSRLPISSRGHRLVSATHPPSGSGAKEVDGYFIQTKSPTKQKASWLRKIAENIGLRIDIFVDDSGY